MPRVRKLLLCLIFSVALMPIFVSAHGNRYLEFNPDSTSSLKVSDVAIPSQVLFPQSDFLGGFDFWVANPSSSGTAVFSLLNEGGSILSSKTVIIGNIAETETGTRLHVDLNSQVAVLGNQKYSVKITSSMPELRLYYSNRVQVIAHNAPFISEYITGVGKLGNEEQDFSFKYALYETTESSAPIPTNIMWTIISSDRMKLEFNANEPVDYRVEYGPSGQGHSQSTSFLGEYNFCVSGIAICSLNVQVSPNTEYQYLLTIKDSWGNQTQSSGAFTSGSGPTPSPVLTTSAVPTSLPQASLISPTPASSPVGFPVSTSVSLSSQSPAISQDNNPPIISNLRIANLNNKKVEIAWTTNEAANSHVLISTPFFITVTDGSDSTTELEHLIKIDNLGANSRYIATITSNDISGNTSKASLSFNTLPSILSELIQQQNQNNQASTPGQSNQSVQGSGGSPLNNVSFEVSSGGAGIISWNLSKEGEPSDGYRVDVFNKDGNLIKTILVPKGSYSVKIDELEDDEYSAIVYANNDGVFEKIDQPAQLKTRLSFIKRLISFWWVPIPLLAGLGYMLWRNFRKKSSQIVQTSV